MEIQKLLPELGNLQVFQIFSAILVCMDLHRYEVSPRTSKTPKIFQGHTAVLETLKRQ